ncbi:hypothetical protein BJF82_09120 [Kytococcus sp. CUA-901]|nr:hypothetical protein BJF82_09120 [Kytococcus sp. CUA-901]
MAQLVAVQVRQHVADDAQQRDADGRQREDDPQRQHLATGPATAIETGIIASDTKKSSELTRPSIERGTRRCSRVPQMTMPTPSPTPNTKSTRPISQKSSVTASRKKGMAATDHTVIITVR